MKRQKFKKGDQLLHKSTRFSNYELTTGKIYEALKDEEEGIFASDPYICVRGNTGREYTCHASRFELTKD